MRHLLLIAVVIPLLLGARTQERPPEAPSSKFQAEFLTALADVETKLMLLAQAVPAEKYTWRPAPGIRSVSEVFTHVAGSNYVLLTFIGKSRPGDVPDNMESITDKARVVAELQKSFAHLRSAAGAMQAADLEKPVRLFGNHTTQRGVYTTILNHLYEHLGQSIAYSRMNGVVPPWTGAN